MINKKFIDGWEKKLDKAIVTGKGQFSLCLVRDIHDYRNIISLLRDGNVRKAAKVYYGLDTSSQEEIPRTVWTELEKELYA